MDVVCFGRCRKARNEACLGRNGKVLGSGLSGRLKAKETRSIVAKATAVSYIIRAAPSQEKAF